MAAGTRMLCCLIICSLVGSSGDQTNITAELGQDVNLTCKVPNKYNITITAVKWIRPDQDSEYVLVYRDGHLDPDSQHPSYQNRVDLQDKEMKDGDVSLILKKVKMEDNGRYKCLVFEKGKKHPISNITLEVHVSGDKGGITGGSVGGVILLVVAALGFLISRWRRRQNPNLPVPPDEVV